MRRGQKTSAEQVVLTLRQIEVQTAQGKSLALACKEAECQTALKIDPGSASNFDPLDGYGGTPLIARRSGSGWRSRADQGSSRRDVCAGLRRGS